MFRFFCKCSESRGSSEKENKVGEKSSYLLKKWLNCFQLVVYFLKVRKQFTNRSGVIYWVVDYDRNGLRSLIFLKFLVCCFILPSFGQQGAQIKHQKLEDELDVCQLNGIAKVNNKQLRKSNDEYNGGDYGAIMVLLKIILKLILMPMMFKALLGYTAADYLVAVVNVIKLSLSYSSLQSIFLLNLPVYHFRFSHFLLNLENPYSFLHIY